MGRIEKKQLNIFYIIGCIIFIGLFSILYLSLFSSCSDAIIDAINEANDGNDLPFPAIQPAEGTTITGHEIFYNF